MDSYNKLPYLIEILDFDRKKFYSKDNSLKNCGCCDKEFYVIETIDDQDDYVRGNYCKNCADAYEYFDRTISKAIYSMKNNTFSHIFYKYLYDDSPDAFFDRYRAYVMDDY